MTWIKIFFFIRVNTMCLQKNLAQFLVKWHNLFYFSVVNVYIIISNSLLTALIWLTICVTTFYFYLTNMYCYSYLIKYLTPSYVHFLGKNSLRWHHGKVIHKSTSCSLLKTLSILPLWLFLCLFYAQTLNLGRGNCVLLATWASFEASSISFVSLQNGQGERIFK